MKRIKLDMLDQISFGNKEYLEALLEGAEEELREAVTSWSSNKWGGNSTSAFNVLHKVKTTLGMLQASSEIVKSQDILDRLPETELKEVEGQITDLVNDIEHITHEVGETLASIRS
jgi:hypothetical protein